MAKKRGGEGERIFFTKPLDIFAKRHYNPHKPLKKSEYVPIVFPKRAAGAVSAVKGAERNGLPRASGNGFAGVCETERRFVNKRQRMQVREKVGAVTASSRVAPQDLPILSQQETGTGSFFSFRPETEGT